MTTKTSKQRTSGALIEENNLDERAPDNQPDEAAIEENSVDERASNTQQGTQQFVTFIAGDEVFAADYVAGQGNHRVPEVVRVPLAPAALEGWRNCAARYCPSSLCAAFSALPS